MGASDNTTTSTSSSAPTNPQVTATTNNLLSKLDTATNAGVPVFNQSLYVPNGATTQQGQSMALSAANNPLYGQGVNGALGYANNLVKSGGLTPEQQSLDSSYQTLGGAYDTQSPAEQRLRSNLVDTTLQSVNGIFNNSGRFGGGSNNVALGKGLGDALAGFDTNIYDKNVANQYNSLGARSGLAQQGVNNAFGASASLPGLFSAGQLPSSIYGAVGSAQDADANAQRQAANDLYQRVNGAQWDTLGRASSILGGTAGSSGTTTTNTQPATPWYQTALAGGIGLGSLLLG